MRYIDFHNLKLTLAAAAALAFALPAMAQQQTPGITESAVRIGVTAPLTGPAAAIAAVSEGIRVRIEAANAAGGVAMGDGRTRMIELLIEDDAFDPQRSLSNVRRLVERSQVFAIVGTAGTPNNLAIGRYTQRSGIPNIFMYSGVHELNGAQWEMGFVPAFTTEARAFAQYLQQHKPQAKVALLYLNTETGEIFSETFTAALEGSAVTIVGRQPVTATDPTVETQLSTLRASAADTLVIVTAPRQGAEAVRFQSESGWQPTTLVSNIASSVSSLAPAGLDHAKGIITSAFLKQVNDERPSGDAGIDQYLKDRKAANARFSVGDTIGQTGYAIGDALVKALENTQEPTREALMDAVRNMDGWQNPLLIDGIELTTKAGEDVYPVESLQLLQFDGAEYQPIGGVLDLKGTAGGP